MRKICQKKRYNYSNVNDYFEVGIDKIQILIRIKYVK